MTDDIEKQTSGEVQSIESQTSDLSAAEHSLENQLSAKGDYVLGYDEAVYDLGSDAADPQTRLERIQSIKSLSDEIPDKFSGAGLLSLIGCTLENLTTWGSNMSWALYLQKFLNEDIFPGATKLEFGIVGGLTFGAGLTFAPMINFVAGKIGIKPTILLGALIQFAGVFIASFSTKLWHLYLCEGAMQGLGMAMVAVPSMVIVPQWFKGGPGGKRNVAMGIMAAGTGVGGIVFNIGMEPIMSKYSWRWALRTNAIICLVVTIASCFMLKSRNKNVKPIYKIYDKLVWHNFGTRLLVLWTAFTQLGYVTLMFNLGDFTRSMGYGSTEAAVVSAMIAVGIVYGRPLVGYVGDIIGPTQVTIIADLLCALFAFAMWIPCKNYATAIVMAMFQGSLMGSIWVTLPTMNGAVIGLRKFGIGMAVSWIAVGIFGMISPIVGNRLKGSGPPDRSQYLHPAIFVGCSYLGAGTTLCFLRAWLIARSRHTDACATEETRLQITVSPMETLRCFFVFGPKV